MKRLEKSLDKKLTGVCGGLAEYFDMDANLVRAALVIGGCVTGFFPIVPLYFAAAVLMPNPEYAPARASR